MSRPLRFHRPALPAHHLTAIAKRHATQADLEAVLARREQVIHFEADDGSADRITCQIKDAYLDELQRLIVVLLKCAEQ